jgi:hypothetical protein
MPAGQHPLDYEPPKPPPRRTSWIVILAIVIGVAALMVGYCQTWQRSMRVGAPATRPALRSATAKP